MAGLLHMIMAQWSEPNFLESSVIPRLLCVLALAVYERSLGRILFFMGFPSSCIMEFIKIVFFFFFFLIKMQTQKIREDYWGKKKNKCELPKSPTINLQFRRKIPIAY